MCVLCCIFITIKYIYVYIYIFLLTTGNLMFVLRLLAIYNDVVDQPQFLCKCQSLRRESCIVKGKEPLCSNGRE